MSIRFLKTATAAAVAAILFTACAEETTGPDSAPVSLDMARIAAPPVSLAWQAEARTVVIQNGMSPLAAGRMFAALGLASMRAVEAVERAGVAADQGNGYGPGGRSLYEARRGAVAGASARVLGWFRPASATAFDGLLTQQANVGPGNIHPQFARGVEAGRRAGDAMIQHLMTDGFTAAWTGTIPVGPGLWTPGVMPPAGATLGSVKPHFIESAAQFRPPPPPAYLSPDFNADLAEVTAIRTNITPAQSAIARRWAYGAGTYGPVGFWNDVASNYVAADGLDEAAAARVFGLMGAAVFDGMITGFGAKYHYWMLRPHQANAALTTEFTVPNYPAYPSGHGSVSKASAHVLEHFFPGRQSQLDALVEEALMSRIYAGIHYRFDMTASHRMAEAVADWVLSQ